MSKKENDKDKVTVDAADEEEMETVKATASEIIAKPLNVEEFPDKADASKRTKEEKRKDIEDNVLEELDD